MIETIITYTSSRRWKRSMTNWKRRRRRSERHFKETRH
jgi:hypothetical protein